MSEVFEKIAENDGKIVDTSLASSVEDSMQFLLESNLQGDSVDPLLLADSSKFDMGDIWASSGSSVQLNDALSVCMTDRETSCQQTRHRRSRRRTRSTHTFKVPVGRGWIPVFRTSTETAHQDVLALSVTVAPKQEDSTSGSAELQELRMDLVSRGVKWSNKIIDQKIIKGDYNIGMFQSLVTSGLDIVEVSFLCHALNKSRPVSVALYILLPHWTSVKFVLPFVWFAIGWLTVVFVWLLLIKTTPAMSVFVKFGKMKLLVSNKPFRFFGNGICIVGSHLCLTEFSSLLSST
ncbi:unnamed protein product [Schistocephalus solidus]|uniref:CUE domain-containing protein n=1 Tax=Schistocephalus solidus TaxID=70667 RepID=A0A183SVM5_SCHSO|nr:unnamed protein product [Schistocephalus solidus]